MNFLAIAELAAVLLLVLFVLRALIGVRHEYRIREGRLHMQLPIDESRGVGAPALLDVSPGALLWGATPGAASHPGRDFRGCVASLRTRGVLPKA